MPVELINARGLSDAAHGLTIAALIIRFLYLAGVIVQPLAIAALLSFILALVRHLQRSLASSAPVRESRSGAKMEHVDLTKPPSGDSLAVMTEPRLSKIAHFS